MIAKVGKQYPAGHPSDVSDEEWAFVAPYLASCREDAPQHERSLRAVFNGLRYIASTGNQCSSSLALLKLLPLARTND